MKEELALQWGLGHCCPRVATLQIARGRMCLDLPDSRESKTEEGWSLNSLAPENHPLINEQYLIEYLLTRY